MAEARWEVYSHPSDIGVRGLGPTKEQAFAQAALALTAVITDPETVAPHEPVAIRCAPPASRAKSRALSRSSA